MHLLLKLFVSTAAIVASAQSNNYSLPAKVTFSLSLLEQIVRDAQGFVTTSIVPLAFLPKEFRLKSEHGCLTDSDLKRGGARDQLSFFIWLDTILNYSLSAI